MRRNFVSFDDLIDFSPVSCRVVRPLLVDDEKVELFESVRPKMSLFSQPLTNPQQNLDWNVSPLSL